MVSIINLWLPILLSAVIVFIASSIIHMVLPYHRKDFVKVPDEAEIMSALRQHNVPPGEYVMPHAASPKEMASEEYIAKTKEGPNAILTVASGPPAMGKLLAYWFIYCLVVSVFAAYIAGQALAPGAEYLKVFQFASCTAFLGYALALVHDSIWFARSWSTTLKYQFDGLVYAALTGGMFGWLWPA